MSHVITRSKFRSQFQGKSRQFSQPTQSLQPPGPATKHNQQPRKSGCLQEKIKVAPYSKCFETNSTQILSLSDRLTVLEQEQRMHQIRIQSFINQQSNLAKSLKDLQDKIRCDNQITCSHFDCHKNIDEEWEELQNFKSQLQKVGEKIDDLDNNMEILHSDHEEFKWIAKRCKHGMEKLDRIEQMSQWAAWKVREIEERLNPTTQRTKIDTEQSGS